MATPKTGTVIVWRVEKQSMCIARYIQHATGLYCDIVAGNMDAVLMSFESLSGVGKSTAIIWTQHYIGQREFDRMRKDTTHYGSNATEIADTLLSNLTEQ